MGDDLTATVTPGGLRIDASSLSWRFSRSSGPGGQHVNTTDSRVELTCELPRAGLPAAVLERIVAQLGTTLVRVAVSSSRSQRRNRELAWERLAERLDTAARPPRRRRQTRPTRASVERRLAAKRRRSDRKSNRRWTGDA